MRGVGQGDEAAPRIAGIDAPFEQPGFGQGADPAQRRGGRHGGGHAQAGHRHIHAFHAGRGQIEQHVPRRIGEDFGWKMPIAITAQADQPPHQLRADLHGRIGIGGLCQPLQRFGNAAGVGRQRHHMLRGDR